MKKEIKKRIASAEWDYRIASAVINRRRKANRRIITAGIAASFLIALTLLITPAVRTSDSADDDGFIAEQVSGVYAKAYGTGSAGDPVEETLDSIILQ